jgi:hypothetical protein
MASIKHVQPTRLYRYRSVLDLGREIKVIKEHYLHCSHYEALNDPLEGFFRSSRQLGESGRRRAVREQIIGDKDALRICSFSEVNNNHVLWAHYADKFSGICVSYSFSRLLKNLGDNIRFTRMSYRQTVPTIRATNKPSEEAKRVLSYKYDRWAYENEWRMFSEQDKTSYSKVNCVSRVYIGSRMPDDKKQRLINDLTSLNISISEMKLHKYSIVFKSIFESNRGR